jgi:hypothetical protein
MPRRRIADRSDWREPLNDMDLPEAERQRLAANLASLTKIRIPDALAREIETIACRAFFNAAYPTNAEVRAGIVGLSAEANKIARRLRALDDRSQDELDLSLHRMSSGAVTVATLQQALRQLARAADTAAKSYRVRRTERPTVRHLDAVRALSIAFRRHDVPFNDKGKRGLAVPTVIAILGVTVEAARKYIQEIARGKLGEQGTK